MASKQTQTNIPPPLAIPNTLTSPISASLTEAQRRKSVSTVQFGTSMLQAPQLDGKTPVSDQVQQQRDKRIEMRIRWDSCAFWSKVTLALLLVATWIGLLTWGLISYRNQWYEDNAAVIIWKPVNGNIPVNGNTTGLNKPGPTQSDCSFVYDAQYGDFARLEPPWPAKPYVGFNIDWQNDNPSNLETRLGHRSTIIGAFLHIDNVQWEKGMLEWFANTLKKQALSMGKGVPASTLMIAFMPDVALDQIPHALLDDFAQYCANINYKYGVPLMIRFAHEMNGNWNPYGQRPIQFKKTWIELTTLIRKYTNMTAMVWAPNMGAGFPFSPSAYSPPAGSAEYLAMDTNKDGVVNNLDDPYTPFYPGDAYVDWVALSVYWFGDTWPQVSNKLTPDRYFETIIRGNSDLSKLYGNPVWDFYDMFSNKRNKPMAVPESGAVYYSDAPGGPGPGEMALKQSWWRQSFNAATFKSMPRLKAIVHFEEAKVEERGHASYLITVDPNIRSAFLKDLPSTQMTWVETIQYSCDGKIYPK